MPNPRNNLDVSEQPHASLLLIKANTLLFIMCTFTQQLQHVGTILGESRSKEETGNQLAKSSQHTNRGDAT